MNSKARTQNAGRKKTMKGIKDERNHEIDIAGHIGYQLGNFGKS